MKVYVAECVWYYEGAEILGVFKTEEAAYRVGQQRREVPGFTPLRGDELDVTEWEVEE